MVALLGWAGTIWVLVSYAHLSRTGRARPFHYANALGCVLCAADNASIGAWRAVALNATFGIAGWFALLRRSVPTNKRGQQ